MTTQTKQPQIDHITIYRELDDNPDLDYLKTDYDEDTQTIIKSDCYTQEDVKRLGWPLVKQWIEEDHKQLDDYGRTWTMIGILAEAQVSYPEGRKRDRRREWFTSGGLWGIHSEADSEYLAQVEQEQLEDLKAHLARFNVDTHNWKQIKVRRHDST